MTGKLTFITAPDFYENGNLSIFFVGLTEQEQEAISKWISDKNIQINVNLYVFDKEDNTPWFLYALARSDYKYINLDNLNYLTQTLCGYMLAKSQVYYTTNNEFVYQVSSHINQNKLDDVTKFLEIVFRV